VFCLNEGGKKVGVGKYLGIIRAVGLCGVRKTNLEFL
jgi:hypothetical protein